MSRLGTLGTLLDRVRTNRVKPPTRLRFADVAPSPAVPPLIKALTPPPVSEDSPEIVVAPSSAPVIESIVPEDIESLPPGDSEPPAVEPPVELRPLNEKPTKPGMPIVEPRPLSTPPLELAPEMAAVRAPEPVAELDAPFIESQRSFSERSAEATRFESEPSPMSASDPLTAPRIIVDEAAIAAAADDERTSPFFQVSQKVALESARTVPLEEAREAIEPPREVELDPEVTRPVGPPPLPVSREVELTPTPTPPPAPAIEEAVRAGSLKLTPVTITPMRLEARGVGEFIGEAQHAVPASFGDAVDASLSLTFVAP